MFTKGGLRALPHCAVLPGAGCQPCLGSGTTLGPLVGPPRILCCGAAGEGRGGVWVWEEKLALALN